jgi:hypothetical protein
MNFAKRTLFAAVGAGDAALDQVMALPKRVSTARGSLSGVGPSLRAAPGHAAAITGSRVKQAAALLRSGARSGRELASKRAERTRTTYANLAGRGEKLVKRIYKARPTQQAIAQTKAARSRVKAAATSVRNATRADAEPVKAAAETAAG